jgi:hypothetical protein
MWKVENVECHRSFAWNARNAIAVRIDEMYAHVPALDYPHDSRGMHDLRISVKRLRYSLEFFTPCYASELVAPILDALSELQDHLGELHDADVLIPEFQRSLDVMSSSAARLVARRSARPRASRRPMSFEQFRRDLARGSATSDRAGVLGAINRMRRQRHENYRAAVAMWRRLESDGFRQRLHLLTVETDSGVATSLPE